MSFRKKFTTLLFLSTAAAFVSTPTLAAGEPAPGAEVQEKLAFKDFPELRTALIGMIGGATTRLWMSTTFLSDGEVVSSLYIAQYRKVNIQVLLGQGRATNVFSRLSYLKQVNIPVAITPQKFYPAYPTIILIDDKLIVVNSSMNNLEKLRSFTISTMNRDQIPAFENAFLAAASGKNAPNAVPLPLVGRKNAHPIPRPTSNSATGAPISTNSTPSAAPTSPRVVPRPSGTTAADGSYRYSTSPERPEHGIATKLPRTTILQERTRTRASTQVASPVTQPVVNTTAPAPNH
jgi:hypothetical protein